nr:MFS transporter [uncultured Campylobacter sp.]
MIRYIVLLRHSRNYRLLFSAGFICMFGLWFSVVGVATLLIELGAPVWAITAVGVISFVPNVFLAPINGIIVDKFQPKPLMTAMFITEMISIFMLIFIDSLDYLWLLLLIVVVRSVAGTLFFQTESSTLPKFLSRSYLKLANEMTGIIWTITYTFGMASAGVFIHYFGVQAAFILDFCLYVFAFFILLRLNFKDLARNAREPVFKMLKDGFSYLCSHPLVVHLIVLHAFVAVTTYDNLIALLAKYRYKEILSASLVIGLMNMSRSAAAFFGQIWLSKIVNKHTFFWILLGQFAGIALWAVLEFNYWLSFAGMIAAGFFITTVWSYSFTQLQSHVDREFFGRVIAYNDMAYFIVATLVSAAIGFFFELGFSLSQITFGMGFMFAIAAFYYKFLIYEKI